MPESSLLVLSYQLHDFIVQNGYLSLQLTSFLIGINAVSVQL